MKANNNKYSLLYRLDRDGPCQQNLKSIFLNLFVCLILFLSLPRPAYGLKNITSKVTVMATVGEPKLTLFGYTSPSALVNLSGIGVTSQVIADQTGYFQFNRVFLPLPYDRWTTLTDYELAYPELYLQAIDTNNRASSPVLLPNLPLGLYEISIGPILISPTISLEKGSYSPGEQIVASGQTLPNSEVTVYLANNNQSGVLNWWQKINPFSFFNPPSIYAYFIPKYQIISDNNGNYQFNLPNNLTKGNIDWKVFSASLFLEEPTPKSNSLSFQVLSLWQYLWLLLLNFFKGALVALKPFLFWLIILIEFTCIILLFTANVKTHLKEKSAEADMKTLG